MKDIKQAYCDARLEITSKEYEFKRLEEKFLTLKQIILLTHESMGHIEMNQLTIQQWLEFVKIYPDENADLNPAHKRGFGDKTHKLDEID